MYKLLNISFCQVVEAPSRGGAANLPYANSQNGNSASTQHNSDSVSTPRFRNYVTPFSICIILILSYINLQSQTITAKQRDAIIIDNGVPGKADPGDRIMYDVTISNSGATQGNNTQMNIVPDPRTTFVAGTFKSSPLALDDNYTATGNIGITIPAATGVLANDFDDNIPGLTVTAGTFATTQGGSIILSSNGSFTYTPKAGFTGSDQYVYTLNDGNPVGAPVPMTNTGTITFTVSQIVWFIDNSSAGTNTGTFSNPFTSIAAFNTANTGASFKPQDNDFISIRKGTGTYAEPDGINLRNGQKLIGEAVQFNTVFTADVNSISTYQTFASGTMTAPVITASAGNGVDILVSNTLKGFNIGNCSGIGINGLAFGTLTLNTISINSTGQAMTLINGTIAGSGFSSVSSSGGVNNISLGTLSGTLALGSGTLSGSTGASFVASQGTATVTYSGTINKTTGTRMIDIQDLTSGSYSFSGSLTHNAATVSQESVFLNANSTAAITFSGGLALTSTSTGAVFSATNGGTVTVTGAGNTISSTVGTGLNLQSTNAGGSGISFASIICSSGQVANINSSTGTKTLGRIGTSSGATTALSLMSAGTINAGDVSLSSTLTTSTGTGIIINGTTLNLTGLGVATTASGNGIGLNMTGGTVNITGKIVINTISGVGFNATSGGTVSLTGSANTITSTTGTALNVSNTNIGASNLNFLSISSNGAANGIILNTTGSSGSLIVTGNGTAISGGDNSGGTIQSSTSAIILTSTNNPSFTNMNIQASTRSGINGTGVTNFTFNYGKVNNSGSQNADANIAFNTTNFSGAQTLFGNNINGTLTMLGNQLTNGFSAGLDIQCDNGTISYADVENNTVTNPGSGTAALSFVGTGNASTSFNITKATVANNTISGQGSGGIQFSIGNSNTSGPGAIAGVPGSSTNIISITGNSITSIDASGTQAITVANSGGNPGSRTQTNFEILNNGTMATPLASSSLGTVILIGNNGYSTMTGTCNNNVIAATHTPNLGGGNGIAGGNGVAGSGNAWTPDLTLTVSNNTITGTDGNGILLVGRSTSGILKLKIANNNVGTPVNAGGSARPGIRVDAGNASSADDAVCLNITGNTSGGSNSAPGIGIRKQGTNASINDFGVVGFGGSTCVQVEAYIAGLNPGSVMGSDCASAMQRVLVFSGDNFISCNSAP